VSKSPSLYRPADLRTTLPAISSSALRSKARALSPEAWDPGQVVDEVLYRGVVWSLGPEIGRGRDSRWVVCEDGVVRVANLSKESDGSLTFSHWAHAQNDYVPTGGGQPFSVSSWGGEPELAEQPSIFDLALAA
jgi:hypothetical protein